MRTPSVSAGLVAGLRDYAQKRGVAVVPLLERAGLAGSPIDDPDLRVPLARYLALLRWARLEIDDPLLALHYGSEAGMAELSIVGLSMKRCSDARSSSTLRTARSNCIRMWAPGPSRSTLSTCSGRSANKRMR